MFAVSLFTMVAIGDSPDNYDTDYPFEIGDTFKIVEIEDAED